MKNYRFSDEYPFLSIISTMLKISAILVLLVTAIVIFFTLFSSLSISIGMGVCGFICALTLLVLVELIKVIVRIEINTRKGTEPIILNHPKIVQSNYIKETPNNPSYENWKKENPGKDLNDYYSAMKDLD